MADCLGVDCGRVAPAAPRAARNYDGVEAQAKDYDSLLRAMLDRLAQIAPEWRDRNEADLGMVLLELFAYAGDQLSWLQDRVALEGYLRTATQHESLRKLLALIGYTMDPGQAGEADLLFEVQGVLPLFLPAGFAVQTLASPGSEPVVYETLADALLQPALSRIALAADAPSSADGRQARLAANLGAALVPGDRLLLQQGAQREWAEVESLVPGAVTVVHFRVPLRARYAAGGTLPASVHGNVVPAGHGQSQLETLVANGAPGQRITLALAPISQVPDSSGASRQALSVEIDGSAWAVVDDFIDSAAADQVYRVSRDNEGQATLHFGDGVRGAVPPAGAAMELRYRVGNGLVGRVSADTLVGFDHDTVFADPSQQLLGVRNPFASRGMRDPQTPAQARLLGPYSLRSQARAVLPADYETLLAAGVAFGGGRVAPLQSLARMRHTGSWTTVFVSVDLPGRVPLAAQPGLRQAFESLLAAHKMAGLDLRVEDARYCPLHIALMVEVDAAHFARDVRAAVEAALLGPATSGAELPLFAPGRLRFGQAVALSDLYGVVSAVEGVRSVAVTRFKRLGDRYPDAEAAGLIAVGALEVARCDNDPADTANGVLYVRTCGGKEG